MKNGCGDLKDRKEGAERRTGQADQGDQRCGGDWDQDHRLKRPLHSLKHTQGGNNE